MKEHKCERRLSDPLDPPREETIQMACDVLEHHLKTMRELNRKSKLPIEVTEEHIKIINRFMEEKKTKKMTKAEAFEWLKGKKVRVSDEEMNDRVQSKLFACGVQWKGGSTNVCYYSDYLVINPEGFLCHCDGLGEDYWNSLFHEEISADDILSIEIVEEKKNDERKGEILEEIAKLGEKISDLIEEYEGDIIIEIDQYEVLLRNSGDILYRK